MNDELSLPAPLIDGELTAETLTHKQAVRRMAKWLKDIAGYNVVIAELTTASMETPDVVGWSGSKGSILVEVKVSRADFHADKQKRFRHIADLGMGDRRYFAAPKGMLTPDDLPPNWGMLEITKRAVFTTVEAEYQKANKSAEVTMLVSSIRRLELATCVFVRQEVDV